MNWREGIMRMLRLRDFTPPAEDEKAEQEQIKRAQIRLRHLDSQLDIIERRGKTHVEPR